MAGAEKEEPRKLQLLDLPEEVLDLIMRHAMAPGPATTFPPPQPKGCSYDDATFSWARTHSWPAPPAEQRLVALASTCRQLRDLATPLVWRAPNISTIVSANRLADAIRASSSSSSSSSLPSSSTSSSSPPANGESGSSSRHIRHLHIPNDGLLLGKKDVLAERVHWPASLETILSNSVNLETVFLATMPGGDALTKFLSSAASPGLKRVVFSCLSSSEPPFQDLDLSAIRAATHLHFIQSLHYNVFSSLEYDMYKDVSSVEHLQAITEGKAERVISPLEVVRFSRLHCGLLDRIANEFYDDCRGPLEYRSSGRPQSFWLPTEKEIRALMLTLEPLRGGSNASVQGNADEILGHRQMFHRQCLREMAGGVPEHFPKVKLILLELSQLAELDVPEYLEPLSSSSSSSSAPPPKARRGTDDASTGGTGAPFDEFSAGTPGALQTVDFPSDVALNPSEMQERHRREEEVRCKGRDEYWDGVKRGKEALEHVLNFNLAVQRRNRAHLKQKDDPLDEPIRVRVVAPRPGGWDRNESLVDFLANAEACSHSSRGVDKSAFNDPDIFELVEQEEKDDEAPLGYNYAMVPGTDRRVAYWTGVLPRSARRRKQELGS